MVDAKAKAEADLLARMTALNIANEAHAAESCGNWHESVLSAAVRNVVDECIHVLATLSTNISRFCCV